MENRRFELLTEACKATAFPITPIPRKGAGLPPAANQTTPNSEVINLPPLFIQRTFFWSRWQDSNLRFPDPKSGDLTRLAYTRNKQ